jgi:hypothetical protein
MGRRRTRRDELKQDVLKELKEYVVKHAKEDAEEDIKTIKYINNITSINL